MVALAARCARLRDVGFRPADRHAGDHDIERAALYAGALSPDPAAVADHDLLADV